MHIHSAKVYGHSSTRTLVYYAGIGVACDLYLCKTYEIFIFGFLVDSLQSGKCRAHYLCLYKLNYAIYGIYWNISALALTIEKEKRNKHSSN